MALGLSGGVMAMIINLFVRMAAGAKPWPLGLILGVIIGVFGHALNVALGILGAYVHSSRLQFLEFYGKFFEGGGRAFRPLRAERKYTFVVKQKEVELWIGVRYWLCWRGGGGYFLRFRLRDGGRYRPAKFQPGLSPKTRANSARPSS